MLNKMNEIRSECMGTFWCILFPFWCTVIRTRVGIVSAIWTYSTNVEDPLGRLVVWWYCSSDEMVFTIEEFTVAFSEPRSFEIGISRWCKGITNIHIFGIPRRMIKKVHCFDLNWEVGEEWNCRFRWRGW